jgi:hypothetical protein
MMLLSVPIGMGLLPWLATIHLAAIAVAPFLMAAFL